MSEDTPEIVQPSEVAPLEPKPKKIKRARWIWSGIAAMLVITILGGLIGYGSAMRSRMMQQSEKIAILVTTQFELGKVDINEGRYSEAQTRFEYVLRIDPDYPGAAEQLAEAMLQQALAGTPTQIPVASETATPTPDFSGVEDLFNQIRAKVAEKDWEGAIGLIRTIRDEDYTYRPVEVDDMFFLALRFGGVKKLMAGDLEGGLYYLALSEQIAPLDGEADGYRTWTRYYLIGASYWMVNWEKAVYYFAQVAPNMPFLMDSSGLTATERYRLALKGYGEALMKEEKYCDAEDYLRESFSVREDPEVEELIRAAALGCRPPEPTKTPRPKETPIPTEETLLPTEVPPLPTEAPPLPTESTSTP